MLPVCSLLTFGVCLTGTGSDTHFELARGVDEVEETCLVLRGYHQSNGTRSQLLHGKKGKGEEKRKRGEEKKVRKFHHLSRDFHDAVDN